MGSIARRGLLCGMAGTGAMLAAAPVLGAAKVGPGGFSPERLKRLTWGMQGLVDQGVTAGTVTLLYRKGAIAQVDAVGWRDLEARTPMKRDTLFRIASMSKPVTSVAVLQLVEQGKLSLEEPVDKFLPELANRRVLNRPDGPLDDTHPAKRPITVLDLLTHRSGLVYNFTSTGPISKAMTETMGPANGLGPDEWMKRLGTLPLAWDPGQRWTYSVSTDVLGVLVERVSGEKFRDYLGAHIWGPLGMQDTDFFAPPAKQDRLAKVYGTGEDGKPKPVPIPAGSAPPPFSSGGGGMISTADDYLKFARMMLQAGASVDEKGGDHRILSRKWLRLMTSNWLSAEQRREQFFGRDFWGGMGFGLGVSVVDDIARQAAVGYGSKGSFGWPGAFGTWWQADPVEDMILIFMIQTAPNLGAGQSDRVVQQAGPSPLATFQNLAYDAIES